MGWFGMPDCTKQEAFEDLFSQRQYKQNFELLWEKHFSDKSIAVFTLDGKIFGETILWSELGDELAYKPVSWVEYAFHVPAKYHQELLENSSEVEKEWYEEYLQKRKQRIRLKANMKIRLNNPVEFVHWGRDDTFIYHGKEHYWAVNLRIMVRMARKQIDAVGFTVIECP